MKYYLGLLILVLFELTVIGQEDKIDKLIMDTNNDQLSWICNYACGLYLKGNAADSLIRIGKPLSLKVIPFLADKYRGIIAHYILSNIWINKKAISSSSSDFDKDSTISINYCGLNFFEKKGHIFAGQEALNENMDKWIKRIEKKSNR